MSRFVRVRTANGNHKNEYDVSVEEVRANPDLYEVLDPEPVFVAREPLYVSEMSLQPDVVENVDSVGENIEGEEG